MDSKTTTTTKDSTIEQKLPIDIVVEAVAEKTSASYATTTLNKEGFPMFGASIVCSDPEEAKRLLLATLKANDAGYDEVTRKTKWQ